MRREVLVECSLDVPRVIQRTLFGFRRSYAGPMIRSLIWLAVTGCAASADLGVIQRGPLEGAGASATTHLGMGAVLDKIVVLSLDLRGDVASSNSRFAVGASALGGLPIGDLFHLLGRAGIWRAVTSSTEERGAVPTFELAGFIQTDAHAERDHPEHGTSYGGVMFGVREDLDVAAYTTLFVGYALMFVPGY